MALMKAPNRKPDPSIYNRAVRDALQKISPEHAEELMAHGSRNGMWDNIAYFRTSGKSVQEAAERLAKMPIEPLGKLFLGKFFWFDRVVKASLHGVEKAAMNEDSGPTGGYIVPEELAKRVSEIMAEESIMLSLADVYSMGSATLKIPVTDVGSTATAGKSPFFGGATYIWTGEGAALTESEPQFRQLELKAWELAVYVTSSNQLLEDGGAPLEEYLVKLLGKAGAWAVDYACLVGNGVGKPLGILNAPGALSVSRAGSGHVAQADLVGMAAKLLPASWSRSIWVCHPSVLADLFKITGWQPNQPAQTLFTRPYYVTEKLPALGTVGDIMLFDPGAYAIGDRQQIEIAVSPHINFSKNQSVWRAIIRVDGRPTLDKSVTLADGAQTASAYVTLAT